VCSSDLLGVSSREELIGRPALDFVVPEHRDGARRYFLKVLRSGKSGAHAFMAQRRPGKAFWMETNGERMLDAVGGVSGVFFISRDISDRKRMEAKLEKMAHTDILTGLPNRRRFLELLSDELARCQRYGNKVSIMELDLDHFKRVNDRYGHAAGDETLRQFASLVRGRLRQNDFAGRFGGEEFMLALPETEAAEARLVAERIRRDLEARTVTIDGVSFNVTVSIGLAEYISDETPEECLKRVDAALYRAKQKGRNRVEM
jgi:diguanylate cyclase (GGDEF)-like protein/PAS domain S-box-containing protein